MKYLIDSNTFVAPHRGYAPIDVAISLWSKIKDMADEGIICSIDMVRKELYANDDELKHWLQSNVGNEFFLDFATDGTTRRLSEIINWAGSAISYTDKAKEKFMRMDKADIYLAAFASINSIEWTVVSFESTNHFGSSEIKLPDVCSQFGTKCITLQNMFRELKDTY